MRTDVNLLGNGYASTVLKEIEKGFSKNAYLSVYDFNILRSKIYSFINTKLEYIDDQWVISIQSPVNRAIRRPSNNSDSREWLRTQIPIYNLVKTNLIVDNSLNPGQIIFRNKYIKDLNYEDKVISKLKTVNLATQNLYFLTTQSNKNIALLAYRPDYILRIYK